MKKKKILKILIVLVVLLMFSGIVSTNMTANASELYFDEEGNLIYVTKAGRDTTGVAFRSIGWVIKRYDMPMDAPGQQYIVVKKRTSYSIYDDGWYVSVMKSSQNEILENIGNASEEWRSQLENYGGYVYIDSVMTVVQYGEEQGSIGENGELIGEAYATYEGISVARPWGYPPELMQYYDLRVKYPSIKKMPDIKYTTQSTPISYSSSIVNNMSVGSNALNNNVYNVSEAIPSGERIYANGNVSKYYYEIKCNKVTGVVDIPVKITTEYILNWVDYEGIQHTESQEVDRYYVVKRNFEYFEAESANVYGINGVNVDNYAIIGGKVSKSLTTNVQKSIFQYGNVENHIVQVINEQCLNSGQKVIYGSNGIRPSIPDEDYSALAERAVVGINVRSDKITIDNKSFLADTYCSYKGKTPTVFAPQTMSLYYTDIYLSPSARNGSYTTTNKLTYKNNDNGSFVYSSKVLDNIFIHTPVVCYGSISNSKEYNQDLIPVENTIVLGCDFSLDGCGKGYHSDLTGYGERDYDEFIGSRYVRFPFEVIIEDEVYTANEWIEYYSESRFIVPEYVPIGEYEVEHRFVASNGQNYDVNSGDNTNWPTNMYCAKDKFKVYVTGRLYDLTIENMAKVSNLLFGSDSNRKLKYSMLAVGDFGEGDYIKVNYQYKYIYEGEEIPVAIYEISSYGSTGVSRFKESEIIYFGEAETYEAGISKITGQITSGNEMYIFSEDVSIQDAKDVIVNRDKLITGGYLIINMDAYIYKDNEPYISYINDENARNGYCNMWEKERFVYEQQINDDFRRLEDGDAVCFFGKIKSIGNYRVVGTH